MGQGQIHTGPSLYCSTLTDEMCVRGIEPSNPSTQYTLQGPLNSSQWHKCRLFNLAITLGVQLQIPILLTQIISHTFSVKLDTGSESVNEYMKDYFVENK